jgi:hypothetical protein
LKKAESFQRPFGHRKPSAPEAGDHLSACFRVGS